LERGASKLWLIAVAFVAAAAVVAATVGVAGKSATLAIPRLPVLGANRDVFDGDIGDPFVLPVAGAGYWVFGTNDWPAHVPTGFSTDLVHWQRGPDALPALPRWSAPDPTNSLVWAPAVLPTSAGYVMYVTVPDAATGRECIAAEAATSPAGPYRDTSGGPLVCQADLGGSIDPMIVRDGGGQLHLLWKNDGNCCRIPVALWSQEVTPSGLRVIGPPHRLLSADQAWEHGIVERPVAVAASNSGWWLFHAGNDWQLADYGTGLAYCTTLAGPCRDATPGPYLATHGTEYSPGGLDTFTGFDGRRWVVYAIWSRPARHGRFYCCRSVELALVVST
jgi:hypothetical protein